MAEDIYRFMVLESSRRCKEMEGNLHHVVSTTSLWVLLIWLLISVVVFFLLTLVNSIGKDMLLCLYLS